MGPGRSGSPDACVFYDFLTVHRPGPHTIAAALADAVGLRVADVDVAEEDAEYADARDWDAPVLCGYREVAGDVVLALTVSVSVSGAVPVPPSEAEAARRLAGRLGTTVLYPARERAPSAYWAVGPDGTVTRARVLETACGQLETACGQGDERSPVLTVDAVEAPMGQLPAARVDVLSEILREEHVDTPVADAFAAVTDPQRSAPAGSTVNRAREALLLWERMVRRMADGWAPAGRYPFELYVEDLRTRDRLAELVEAATHGERGPLARAASEVDDIFRRHTEDDAGVRIGHLTKSRAAVAGRGWWWHRRPAVEPWDG